jgi:hypothetical protein
VYQQKITSICAGDFLDDYGIGYPPPIDEAPLSF